MYVDHWIKERVKRIALRRMRDDIVRRDVEAFNRAKLDWIRHKQDVDDAYQQRLADLESSLAKQEAALDRSYARIMDEVNANADEQLDKLRQESARLEAVIVDGLRRILQAARAKCS